MTAGELVAFLAAKGKFIPSKSGFSTVRVRFAVTDLKRRQSTYQPESIRFI
ncbi:hypothetical protein ACLB1T_30175 [Escherichia coli]